MVLASAHLDHLWKISVKEVLSNQLYLSYHDVNTFLLLFCCCCFVFFVFLFFFWGGHGLISHSQHCFQNASSSRHWTSKLNDIMLFHETILGYPAGKAQLESQLYSDLITVLINTVVLSNIPWHVCRNPQRSQFITKTTEPWMFLHQALEHVPTVKTNMK